jgi:predicted unusual protein kinase regulating ubiquinone biosynthesis (AarF/ABC1/UbiB family)
MPDRKAPPTGRVSRTARFSGMVAGQSLRYAGTRLANRTRSEEGAQRAMEERAMAIARELVEQLGRMRGAAMKVGQVLSTVDFAAIPEDERERFKETLSALRDQVPPIPFKRIEKLIREELGGRMSEFFSDFEEQAFAAASIGQVHRATTSDGRQVAVKVQYPGIAEAVDADLRNIQVFLPLVKRLAPGLDTKALAAELRERLGGARLRARGAEPAPGGTRLPRSPVHSRPGGRHGALEPPPAGDRVRGGPALPGRQAAR